MTMETKLEKVVGQDLLHGLKEKMLQPEEQNQRIAQRKENGAEING